MAVNLMAKLLKFGQAQSRSLTSVSSLNIAPEQRAALTERCIVVDENDKAVGDASKLDCHRVHNGKLILHRAFSVFVFNNNGEILLQQRSPEKITFPNCYTNACCSHPLFDFPNERDEVSALGIRLAAQRRLYHELGIPASEAKPESMIYLTRIHYQGLEEKWGEHEIDYILILKGDVTLRPNSEEVSDVKYVARDQLDSWLKSSKAPLTPWFKLIVKHKLYDWWDNLNDLEKFQDHENILRFC